MLRLKEVFGGYDAIFRSRDAQRWLLEAKSIFSIKQIEFLLLHQRPSEASTAVVYDGLRQSYSQDMDRENDQNDIN